MKLHLIGFMALALVFSCRGAEASPVPANEDRVGLLKQTTELLGKKVGDRKESTIGRLEDLVLDLANEQVAVALVSAGRAGELTPVPGLAYSHVTSGKLILNSEKKVFEAAPRIPKAGAIASLDACRLSAAWEHFGERTPPPGKSARLCSVAELMGMNLTDKGGEPLGRVKDAMLDLVAGRVAYLVIEPAAGAGAQPNELYAVPPRAARRSLDGAGLVLDQSKAVFLSGPHFEKCFWTDLAFADMARAVRKHYSIAPADPGGAAVVMSSTAKAGEDGPRLSNQEITQAILSELLRTGNGFMRFNLVVTSINGRVTLTGTVRSERDRKLILNAAERIVGPGNFDDNLQLPSKTKTARL